MSQIETLYTDEAMTNALYPRTKVLAISDDSGTALSEMVLYHGDGIDSPRATVDADLLQGHPASYFENLGLHMELLWENANLGSVFEPQTISLDLSSYNLIAISFKAYPQATVTNGDLHILEKNVSNISVSQGSNAGVVDTRSFQRIIAKIDDSGIEFGNGIGSSGTTESGVNIPIKIYGIR